MTALKVSVVIEAMTEELQRLLVRDRLAILGRRAAPRQVSTPRYDPRAMPDSTEEPRETLRFAWYGRLSTDELQQPQLAFPSQRAACERRVEVGRIVCEFTDVESGRSHERAGIEALLAEVGTRGGAGTASNGEGQETIDLVVRVGPTRVEVLVRCPQHVEFAPTLPPEPGEASRWGVFLVDRISDGWSVVQTQGQIEAWFEIDLPRQIAA